MRFRRTIARLLAASLLTIGGMSVAVILGATPAQAASCYDGAIYSEANHRYVSAELGYTGADYGMLRARASSVGPWERFEICYSSVALTHFSFRSLANGRWVSAELGYTGSRYAMLRARATSIGPWEKFFANEIQSEANGRWTSAELGYTGATYGMLRARAGSIGPWENWTFITM
jgi:hypothetical protein